VLNSEGLNGDIKNNDQDEKQIEEAKNKETSPDKKDYI
jgi:hypothetical protein